MWRSRFCVKRNQRLFGLASFDGLASGCFVGVAVDGDLGGGSVDAEFYPTVDGLTIFLEGDACIASFVCPGGVDAIGVEVGAVVLGEVAGAANLVAFVEKDDLVVVVTVIGGGEDGYAAVSFEKCGALVGGDHEFVAFDGDGTFAGDYLRSGEIVGDDGGGGAGIVGILSARIVGVVVLGSFLARSEGHAHGECHDGEKTDDSFFHFSVFVLIIWLIV